MQNAPKSDYTQQTSNLIALNGASFSPLSLCFALQASLNLYELMKRFHQELKQMISYQNFCYFNKISKHKFEIGKLQRFELRYDLKQADESLGELCISKSVPFTSNEVETLEQIITLLVLPLRNALRYEEVLHLSMLDPLTRLFNRHAFDTTLKREIEFAKRHRTPLSLLVIDLDFFKLVNDQYGHQSGDQVLVEFSNRLKQIHRESDLIFRYGGEEFTLILPNTHFNGAVQVAERICKKIAEKPFEINTTSFKKSISVTASIGTATHLEEENAKRFFSRADGALYTAKARGRNQVGTG